MDEGNAIGKRAEEDSASYLKNWNENLIGIETLSTGPLCIECPDFVSYFLASKHEKDALMLFTKSPKRLLHVKKLFPVGIEVKAITSYRLSSFGGHGCIFKKATRQLKIAEYKVLHLHFYNEELFNKGKDYMKRSSNLRDKRKVDIDSFVLFLNGQPKERVMNVRSLETKTQPSTLSLGANRLCLNEQLQQ